MKVLITGANGQLGLSFKQIKDTVPGFQFFFTDIGDLDITRPDELDAFFSDHPVDYLVNCAAYTAVDKAEEEIEKATRINAEAVRNLAECANKYGFTLIHISTDYVFNGNNYRPYKEDDMTDPLSVYGKTKRAGEQSVIDHCRNGIILRTSWLYSEFGNNFLKTVLRLADTREEIKIVFDQVGTPTYGGDLARAALEMIRQQFNQNAIFHFSNLGVASWYDFGREIIRLTGRQCKIIPIFTEEYPLPAQRPFYSLMSKQKFTETFQFEIPHWKDSLSVCLKNMHEII